MIKQSLLRIGSIWALGAASLLTSMTVHANFVCNVRDFKTNIYFSNSVDISCDEANFVARALREEYKVTLDVNDPVTNHIFLTACNASDGAMADILASLETKMSDLNISSHGLSAFQLYQFLKSFSYEEIRTTINSLDFVTDKNALSNRLTDSAFQELEQAIGQGIIEAMSSRRTVDAVSQANFFELDLIASKKVVVIAHGQGSLFSNAAIKDASQRQSDRAGSISVINVGNIDTEVLSNSFYFSAHDDVVVNALIAEDAEILATNIDNALNLESDSRSVTKHDFIQDYFSEGLASKIEITSTVDDLINLLPYPNALAAEGALRANLTWGAEPDVDLHAFEPNGTQVYYLNKVGQSGELDVDDVTQFGPENYNVACDTLESGRYTIAVNYFSGQNPETAVVTLFLASGQTVSPRKVFLEEPLGTAGNARTATTTVYEIDVVKSLDGSVEFNVQPAPEGVITN